MKHKGFEMVIADLGEKVKELERLLGYAFHKEHFEDATIRMALEIGSAAQWARKKSGVVAVQPHELSKLFVHFQLPGKILTPSVFELAFDEFKQTLKDAGVGTHGLAEGHCVRQAWLNDPKCKHEGITCEPVGRGTERGGFGLAQDDGANMKRPRRFRVGERATIRVAVPADGYLLLLNDQVPLGETTCLMPSLFASATSVKAGQIEIPRKEDKKDALNVMGPPGLYRLFAIWTRMPLAVAPRMISMVREEPDDPRLQVGPPRNVSLTDFVDIHRALQDPSQVGGYAILTTTYEVVNRA